MTSHVWISIDWHSGIWEIFDPCPQSNLTTSFSLSSHSEKGEMETRKQIFSTIF